MLPCEGSAHRAMARGARSFDCRRVASAPARARPISGSGCSSAPPLQAPEFERTCLIIRNQRCIVIHTHTAWIASHRNPRYGSTQRGQSCAKPKDTLAKPREPREHRTRIEKKYYAPSTSSARSEQSVRLRDAPGPAKRDTASARQSTRLTQHTQQARGVTQHRTAADAPPPAAAPDSAHTLRTLTGSADTSASGHTRHPRVLRNYQLRILCQNTSYVESCTQHHKPLLSVTYVLNTRDSSPRQEHDGSAKAGCRGCRSHHPQDVGPTDRSPTNPLVTTGPSAC